MKLCEKPKQKEERCGSSICHPPKLLFGRTKNKQEEELLQGFVRKYAKKNRTEIALTGRFRIPYLLPRGSKLERDETDEAQTFACDWFVSKFFIDDRRSRRRLVSRLRDLSPKS